MDISKRCICQQCEIKDDKPLQDMTWDVFTFLLDHKYEITCQMNYPISFAHILFPNFTGLYPCITLCRHLHLFDLAIHNLL